MRLSDFNEQYHEICRHVDTIFIVDEDWLTAGNVDVIVALKYGGTYSFTIFTLDNIRSLMQRDNLRTFLSPGMLIVDAISVDSILEALNERLLLAHGGNISLDHFGIRQIKYDE